ncbi:MAG: four helix bundle protein [Planctomycetaceae bacterium]
MNVEVKSKTRADVYAIDGHAMGQHKPSSDLRDRTKALALRAIRLYGALPHGVEAQVIGKQLLRSATSVGAHYREASRARSTAEFISKLGTGLQELDETAYWIELLIESEIFPALRLKELLCEIEELIAIFVASSKTAKSRKE